MDIVVPVVVTVQQQERGNSSKATALATRGRYTVDVIPREKGTPKDFQQRPVWIDMLCRWAQQMTTMPLGDNWIPVGVHHECCVFVMLT